VWWNTGERPPDAKEDCTAKIRVLATHYRERILQHHYESDPARWAWLPGATQIRDMSIEDLFAMKARADALLSNQP
jgi:hypothetical protein